MRKLLLSLLLLACGMCCRAGQSCAEGLAGGKSCGAGSILLSGPACAGAPCTDAEFADADSTCCEAALSYVGIEYIQLESPAKCAGTKAAFTVKEVDDTKAPIFGWPYAFGDFDGDSKIDRVGPRRVQFVVRICQW